ncbi:hypothetical protein C482_16048 [Natrialba chahannaoensis JCM 10990]|uniref:Uncharacterized protein n=1 Tax=Natrialba chahannaoensis JCM 10990 TaxID=1227492 RepID=M0AC53_9EURY|nr:hypothetical protein [Natrialba chahannaoensis]ELY96104.1 hypothetical protein C482_16048 [Natrialba chahannaoensis JCM 10990]
MASFDDTDESHSLRGVIDRKSLLDVRDIAETQEPLATAELDDYIDPGELTITLDDGIGDHTTGRFDVRWSTEDDYNIHYSDPSHDFRWDVHLHSYTEPNDDGHHHPPPRASNDDDDVEDSCIDVRDVETVSRAVLKAWRHAYENDSLDVINGLENPP